MYSIGFLRVMFLEKRILNWEEDEEDQDQEMATRE